MREADERYFETLETELDSAMRVAERARERGGDAVDAEDVLDAVGHVPGGRNLDLGFGVPAPLTGALGDVHGRL